MPKTAVEVLKAAKQLLIDEGWVQFNYENAQGYCASGALSAVAFDRARFGTPDEWQAYAAAHAALWDEVQANEGIGIIQFNDTAGRTKEEVLELFDFAIERQSA